MYKKRSTHLVICLLLLSLDCLSQINFSGNATVLKGHRITVWDVDYNSAGNKIAAAGGYNQVVLWENDKELFRTLKSEKTVNKVDFNFDGSLLAYGGFSGGGVHIIDAVTGDEKMIIKDIDVVNDIAFSREENMILVTGMALNQQNATVKLFNANTGKFIRILYDDPKGYPTCVTFSHDGNYVAAGIVNSGTGIRIWNTESGELVQFIPSKGDIYGIDFGPDDKIIAGGGGGDKDFSVHIWDVSSGKLKIITSSMKNFISSISISDDGKYVVAGGMDRTCRFKVWDLETGKLVNTLGNKGPDVNSIQFKPNSHTIILGLSTYGDLFESPTVEKYPTKEDFSQEVWYQLDYNEGNCKLEFPDKPEITVQNKSGYIYHRILFTDAATQMLDIIEYPQPISPEKIDSEIADIANSYTKRLGGTVSSNAAFTNDDWTGKDYVIYKEKLRYRIRIGGVGKFVYYLTYVTYNKEETSKESRFINSLTVK